MPPPCAFLDIDVSALMETGRTITLLLNTLLSIDPSASLIGNTEWPMTRPLNGLVNVLTNTSVLGTRLLLRIASARPSPLVSMKTSYSTLVAGVRQGPKEEMAKYASPARGLDATPTYCRSPARSVSLVTQA